MTVFRFPLALVLVALLTLCGAEAWAARDASFLAPGSSSRGSSRTDQDIIVEPKPEVDVGETPLNVGRRATFFFVNQSNVAVEIESIKANVDSNVRADIVADDCSKEGKILAASRCSVTIETTPTGAGSWTAELLLTHKAAGRIARARVIGRTNAGSTDKGGTGLSLSTKDIKPIDFGEIEVGTDKAVRSALMVNDGNEVITILSIEVIAAENGLQRLEQGCAPDMDLKMGESCPVTMVWKPEAKGILSTDLIIRHTGRLGFAVIPIRGVAKSEKAEAGSSKNDATGSSKKGGGASGGIPMPPTADELEKMMAGKIPPLPSDALPMPDHEGGAGATKTVSSGTYHLIGTVGNRALIYKPDGTTAVVTVGESFDAGEGKEVKLTYLEAKKAEILVDGKKKILILEAAASLTNKAAQTRDQQRAEDQVQKKGQKASTPKTDNMEKNSVPLPMGK
ncbi:MAG: hypothetical protein WC612_07835 [Bdellovibrionales bacterium]|jgi:hypothetical protein